MRIERIDVLRGAALSGILVVNIMAFAFSRYGGGLGEAQGDALSASLTFMVSALFELKFYLLFSFLFGYSVTLQRQSAERAGVTLWPRMLRRNAALFLIGCFHAAMLFHGDILTTYAVLGTVLLTFSAVPARRQLQVAALLIAGTALLWWLLAWSQCYTSAPTDTANVLAHAQQAHAAYTGGPLSIIHQHLRDLGSFLPLLVLLQLPCALAMFLIGHAAGDANLLAGADRYRALQPWAVRGALLLGVPGALIYATCTQRWPGSAIETAALGLSVATAPFLTAGIVVVLLRISERTRVAWLAGPMAAAGRMALTHYLMQSLVCALIFHGYGFGLMDHLSVAAVLGIAAIIYAAQLWISPIWMRHHRYGPLEWLLRAATLGKWPAWRKHA